MIEHKTIWTEERNKRLLELADKGLPASKISDRLTEEAGFSITRNSVMSKLNRLGRKLARIQVKVQTRAVRLARTTSFKKAQLPAEDTLHGARAVLGLRNQQCRWPIGETTDKDFRFCDNDAVGRTCYCPRHQSLAYVPIARRTTK